MTAALPILSLPVVPPVRFSPILRREILYIPSPLHYGVNRRRIVINATARRQALSAAGLVHPRPDLVRAPLFDGNLPFFLPEDKVQVKYEMLRAHVVDGMRVTEAAEQHGYSRAAFYLVESAFSARGMVGLLDERRGRRGPVKLTPEILAFLTATDRELSGAVLVEEVRRRFGVGLHRRTIERARR
jgi:transposase